MSLKGIIESRSMLKGKINRLNTLIVSAYAIAVKNGFEGTEEEWLESLKGEKGDTGLGVFIGTKDTSYADFYTAFTDGNICILKKNYAGGYVYYIASIIGGGKGYFYYIEHDGTIQLATLSADDSWVYNTVENETEVFVASYGVTTYEEVKAAKDAGKVCVLNYYSEQVFPLIRIGASGGAYFSAYDPALKKLTYASLSTDNVWANGTIPMNVKEKVDSTSQHTHIPTAKAVYDFVTEQMSNVEVSDDKIAEAVKEYLDENPAAGSGALTSAQIDALHGMFKVCTYDDSKDVSGAYAAFKTAFGITDSGEEEPDTPVEPDEPEKTLSSISATYSGGDVAVGTAVTDLTGIVVTAHYSDGSSETVTGYTLSGTIAEGSNTITVSYGGKTTTFAVTGVAEFGGENIEMMAQTDQVAPCALWYTDGGETPYEGSMTTRNPIKAIRSMDVFDADTKLRISVSGTGTVYDYITVSSVQNWDGSSYWLGSVEGAYDDPGETMLYTEEMPDSKKAWAAFNHEMEYTVHAGCALALASFVTNFSDLTVSIVKVVD